ncbi:MAG: cytochrome d ubiquinol oxidase subunit II [Ignavibacteria bacterium]|nr:cytochrome d ubiquinol oxidase subunit II [Ignavibacteria bacterium]
MDLNTIWFILIGVLFAGYAILDGFDLGVGSVHLFVKDDYQRRIFLNSIGPVWDGNEVWLITGGGALFAAFPNVYASVFSGFYIALFLLLVVLVFRAVAIEFRSKRESPRWRNSWDIAYSISSYLIAFLLGVAMGNIITGVPLNEMGDFVGNFWTLISPYTVLTGITTVALFMMHGTIYLAMKTEGEVHQKVVGWINNTIIFFVICYVSTTMITLVYVPHMSAPFKDNPILFIIPLLNMLAIANIPREIHHRRYGWAFISSCASIAALLALFAIGIFPNLVISNPNPEFSLNIYNSASSQRTLTIMLIIAIIGMPFVLAYTSAIYWVFRGKVKTEDLHY